jgi:hypothetical protein
LQGKCQQIGLTAEKREKSPGPSEAPGPWPGLEAGATGGSTTNLDKKRAAKGGSVI